MKPVRSYVMYSLSLLAGLALLLAMPGSGGVWPLLFVGLVPLIFAIENASTKQVVFCALLAGMLHYFCQLNWIVTVLQEFGGVPQFVAVLALGLLALYMCCYLVIFCLLGRTLLKEKNPLVTLWFIPALWVGLDWLRSWLFSGFPWMDLGYGLAPVPALIQLAELTGHYGLTYLIVLVNLIIYQLVKVWRGGFDTLAVAKNRLVSRIVLVPLLLFIGVGIGSTLRWQNISQLLVGDTVEKINVGIVQGNIDQSLKWSPELQLQTVEKYLVLTNYILREQKPDIVVWPETALPFYPTRSKHTLLLQELVRKNEFALIAGAPWYEMMDVQSNDVEYYNSAQMLVPAGYFAGYYYKSHLVPFGEYVPLRTFLPFLEPLVKSVGDFTPGVVEVPMEWKTAKVGVLICFESIFPDIAREWVGHGANILVNLTNDAWYGRSSAPHHSLAMTCLRAVETRRNVVRSANTGFSGVIDPLGRVVKKSPLFEPWATVEQVALLEGKTLFVQFGYLFAPLCLGLVCAQLWFRRLRNTRLRRRKVNK